ncbi:MAG: hypothetical protein EBR30_05130 [Cytophagia bacterium]|nr:hypothetical protein [Cytophagia bacterium]NBW34396.1 hypothetical protein [Cytophagia bacterium]
MKLAYKFLGSLFIISATSSCFDPPVFPDTPSIEFVSIEFKEFGGFADPDSLVLKIKFQDGDGDLGINKITTNRGDQIDNINDPFHDSNFFLSDGGSSLKTIGTETFYTDTFRNGIAELVPLKIFSLRGQSGKLVSKKNQAGYSNLPAFNNSTRECQNFTLQSYFVFIDDWDIIDESYAIKDTLRDAFGNDFIHLKDTLYFEFNPNHYNIEVDFLVEDRGNPLAINGFVEYDWRKQFCTTYDGRFPQLSDSSTPLDGILTYSMGSTGFKTIFGSRTLKLKVSIKDRQLNRSNEISTREFKLN